MWLSDVFECTKNLRYDYEKRQALITELEKHRFKMCGDGPTFFKCFNWKFEKLASDDQLAFIKNNAHANRSDSVKMPKLPRWGRSPTRSPSPRWGRSPTRSPSPRWGRSPTRSPSPLRRPPSPDSVWRTMRSPSPCGGRGSWVGK